MNTVVGRALVAAAPLAFLACGGDSDPTAAPILTHSEDVIAVAPLIGRFELCKAGVTSTFAVRVGGVPQASLTLGPNRACAVLASWPAWRAGTLVEVSETSTALGFLSDRMTIESSVGLVQSTTVSLAHAVALPVGNDQGHRVTFGSVRIPNGQGCKAIVWKDDLHVQDWNGYDVAVTWSGAGFDDAFPGVTVRQALGRDGGPLEALGRETAAALLNAASPRVAYGMTPDQVVARFNAVYPGEKGDYTQLRNTFAKLNRRTCPLD